jgi:hypothetical protein
MGVFLALGCGFAARAQESERQVLRVWTGDRLVIQELARREAHVMVYREKGLVVVETDASTADLLRSMGVKYEVDAAATAEINRVRIGAPGQKTIPGFSCYRTVAETNARLTQLVTQYPSLASVVDIGDSWERVDPVISGDGDDLRVIKLTNSATPGPKPVLFVMTAIHAREYTPGELGMRFVEYLLTGYGTNADATAILDHNEVHVLVQSNPDGRRKAETGLSWRKNTNTGYCGVTSNSRGADLNRNFSFKWGQAQGGGGSSTNPCDTDFRGPAPQSEPEVSAVDNYIASIFPDQRGNAITDPAPADAQGVFLDIHSYSQLVLWPWGWTNTGVAGIAPNASALETLGRRFAWFNSYTPEQANELYATDGTTDDNAYGELGVAAYTFELGTAFFQDCASFENAIYPTNLQALIYAAKVARAPYLWPAGPEATNVQASPPLAFAGDSVRLSASTTDTRFNQTNGGAQTIHSIAAANAYVGTPPWQAGAVALALNADDGVFNASIEGVNGNINTTGLGLGRHLVYVQARDSNNSIGPVSAALVNIVDPATHGTLQGTVRAVQGGTPLAATVQASSYGAQSNGTTGAYLHRLPAGTHALTVSAPHYEPASFTGIVVGAGGTINQDVNLYSLCTRLSENAENGVGTWTTQGTPAWGIANASGLMTTRFWTESVSGNYGNNANVSLISPVFDMTGYTNAVLSFDNVCDTEATFDFGIVEVSANGGTNWTEVFRCSGDASLQQRSINLPQIANVAQARLRLRFTSDSSQTAPGWAVDNMLIEAGGSACRATQGTPDALFGNGFE